MKGNLGRTQAQTHETFLLGFVRTKKKTNKLSNKLRLNTHITLPIMLLYSRAQALALLLSRRRNI